MTVESKTKHAARFWRLLASTVAIFSLLTAAVPASAETKVSTQRPFAGKRITLAVGYGVGGGYDAYARLLAPHLERQTGATVIVANWTGGGGLVALNRLAADRSDALTLMLVNGPSAALSQILEREGVRYDLRNLVWLGRVLAEKTVILASPFSSYRSLADVLSADHTVRWGAPSMTQNAGIAALLSQALELNSRFIIGYKGSSESSLAALRGEVDLVVMSETSAKQQSHQNGLIPIAVVSPGRSDLLPDVRTVAEQVDLAPAQARWIDYGTGIMEIGRALAAPGHTTPARSKYLLDVVEKILTDPNVRREATASGRPIGFASPGELKVRLHRALNNLDKTKRNELRHVILEKFVP